MKVHRYKGHDIYPCDFWPNTHGGRWIVQTYHFTGSPWGDQECPHFTTLEAAKESIRQQAKFEAFERAR